MYRSPFELELAVVEKIARYTQEACEARLFRGLAWRSRVANYLRQLAESIDFEPYSVEVSDKKPLAS